MMHPPSPLKGVKNHIELAPLLRLRVAASAFGRRSRPMADEDGGARQGGWGVKLSV
jgi:hypothetical protein